MTDEEKAKEIIETAYSLTTQSDDLISITEQGLKFAISTALKKEREDAIRTERDKVAGLYAEYELMKSRLAIRQGES